MKTTGTALDASEGDFDGGDGLVLHELDGFALEDCVEERVEVIAIKPHVAIFDLDVVAGVVDVDIELLHATVFTTILVGELACDVDVEVRVPTVGATPLKQEHVAVFLRAIGYSCGVEVFDKEAKRILQCGFGGDGLFEGVSASDGGHGCGLGVI